MTNVLVSGANRGLGLGFVKNYLAKNVNIVSATRDLKSSKELLALKEKFLPIIVNFHTSYLSSVGV